MLTDEIVIDAEFARMIPPLSAEERTQLEANLAESGGARDALIVWRSDAGCVLLDGHNRHEICTRLGLPFEVRELEFADRNRAVEWLIRNQFGRRNLSAYDRTMLALRLEEAIAARAKANQVRKPAGSVCQKSDKQTIDTKREIAKAAGVSHDTVAKVKRIAEAVAAGDVSEDIVGKLRSGVASINRVDREIKEKKTEEKRRLQKAEAVLRRKDVEGLHVGDFREIGDLVPDESVDLIFTDPPYDRKAIELFDGLGQFASRVLRPGGSLVAYVGQIQLPHALADLSNHLRYWWTCGCYHGGPTLLRMTEYGVVNGWKPMVWFVKETRGDTQTFVHDVASGTKEKSHHDWQQDESEARYFIERLTDPDGFVVDPFCGGGTTPAACVSLGRKWVAFEIDDGTAAMAADRIAEAGR